MKTGKRNYHHGDLRSAVLIEGMKLLELKSAEGIGLREVARAAGVSATAIYRHFPDKDALLQALASEGFRRLGDAQSAATAAAGAGAAGLKASGLAYVRFACAYPAMFRLMFSHGPGGDNEKDAEAVRAMNLLQHTAADVVREALGSVRAQTYALRAWSLVHGLSHLILNGQIAADESLIEAVLDAELFGSNEAR